jgi:hypothetical protein
MKANELMIGDWVMFPNSIEKVQEISYVCGKGYCASFAASATLFPIPIDKLKPIPITPEILEKNGWKSYSHENTPIFGIIQGFEIVLAWMDYYWQLCVDGTVYRKIRIRYVHELQHALKLCGIEKLLNYETIRMDFNRAIQETC